MTKFGEALALFALLAALGILAHGLCGCSSPLRTHAAILRPTRDALNAGGEEMLVVRAHDLDACSAEPDPGGCLDERETRWGSFAASFDLVSIAWAAWRDAVVDGFGLPDEDVAAAAALIAARHFGDLWTALAELLAPHMTLVLPEMLTALLGGAR